MRRRPGSARQERAGTGAAPPDLAEVFREHERPLFLLAYRMTGSTADAEDVVQETFVRALDRPPADRDRPWRPWLVRVAVNLARDELRRRKRRPYPGPWLPAPLETDAYADLLPLPSAAEPASTEHRYELLESVSFAFLLALEALTPNQRAVLLLHDVLDYSARETAHALGCSEANARTLLHRARRAMAAYDRARFVPTAALRARTQEILGRFLAHVAQRDAAGLEALLAEDVVFVSDAGGEFAAAIVRVHGAPRVADLHVKIARDAIPSARLAELNGVPAVLLEYAAAKPRHARRLALLLQVEEAEGGARVRAVHSVLRSEKLRGLHFPASA